MGLRLKTIHWKNIRLPPGVNSSLYMVHEAMKGTKWNILRYEAQNYKLIISNRDCQMCIYLSTMTIQTALHHPKQGKTQLTRKGITQKEFKKLLDNPRLHTDKGYYVKPK